MEIQAMGQLLSLVASCHNSRRIGGKAKALILAKVMSKGDDRIIVQPLTDFSKVAEQLLNKTSDTYFTGRNFIRNIRSY